jgi:hypothetical protein
MSDIVTCTSFPHLVDELRDARKRGLRLVSAAPDPQLGQAVGFKLSDGATLRLPLARIKQFEDEKGSYPELVKLWTLVSSTEGRIRLYMTC